MEKNQISIEDALNGKRTFYAKKWQQNGYYPIEKYVYHNDTDEFEMFVHKFSGWNSWGISKTDSITNKEWLKHIFENNAYKLSFVEMKSTHKFNCN